MDKTMLGEIRSSSGELRSSTPTVKTYVLMRSNETEKQSLVMLRQENSVSDVFILSKGRRYKKRGDPPILGSALYEYWKAIADDITNCGAAVQLKETGRILFP